MSLETRSSRCPILLVEDNPEDREATLRALRKSRVANAIHHVADGDEALDFLYQRGPYAERDRAPRPGVILLDLNLPGTDGREVLAKIKKDPRLRTIPVVVLTTSTDDRDIRECYSMGVNSYVHKPVDLPGFMEAIGRLEKYWCEIVILPPSEVNCQDESSAAARSHH